MLGRWGVGPVFVHECRQAARRWQLYAVRSGFVALILAALALVWNQYTRHHVNLSTRQAQAEIGEQFFFALIGMEMTLLLLAAPAGAAGALCVDKARGTLHHLFVTDLSDAELVLGKLGARLMPVLGLIACSIPVAFLCTLLGGINPEALGGAFLVLVAVSVLGCAAAVTLSVWGTRISEILLTIYLLWTVVLLAYPVSFLLSAIVGAVPAPPHVLLEINPYWLAFAPYAQPGSVTLETYLIYLGVCLALSAVLVVVAVARVRTVALRQAAQPSRPRRRRGWLRWRFRLFGPSLDGNPVLWREWHRRRPSRWARLVWAGYALLAVGASALALYACWTTPAGTRPVPMVIGFQVAIGLLLLSVAAPNPLGEERTSGALDVLLTTPLPTAAIVWGKWWGTFRTVPRLVVLPAITLAAVVIGERSGRVAGPFLLVALLLAYGAGFSSLGLALATWTNRPGRAVALSAGCYVVVLVGWICFASVLHLPHERFERVAMGSPFYGAGYFSHTTTNQDVPVRSPRADQEYAEAIVATCWWIAIYVVAAMFLFLAALGMFDRRVGRMREEPSRPPPAPPVEAVEALEEARV